ncbi:MAG: hypothetical protein ACTSU2_12840 [Promethearchaeota archaeon]
MSTKAKKDSSDDFLNKNACVYLKSMNKVSNSLQPLCYCEKRDLVLGRTAVVCSVCKFYTPSEKKLDELYRADAEVSDSSIWVATEDFYEYAGDIDVDEDELVDEEEDEEEEDEQRGRKSKRKSKKEKTPKKRGRKRKTELPKEMIDDEESIEAEPEEISEEYIDKVIAGEDSSGDEEELEIEDETEEVVKEYESKEKHLKGEGEDDIEDELLGMGDEGDLYGVDANLGGDHGGDIGAKDKGMGDAVGSTFQMPEIRKTPDGKEICPFCHKEFVSLSRHISRCKRAPPEAVQYFRKPKKKSTGKRGRKPKPKPTE